MTAGSWADYFPFESGEDLKIEAEVLYFSLKGSGRVKRCSDSELALGISLPEQSILGKSIPAVEIYLALTYVEEGKSNSAVIVYNGRRKEDSALAIASDSAEQSRRIDPSIAIGGKTVGFSIVRTAERRAEVRDITGIDLPFELNLKIKPAYG